jgi:AcrR family transcriptional regulator
MAKETAKSTTRTPLTRERVLGAALRLVDEGGVHALSMRKLSRALGVEAMSLYNHVANKDDILDGIVDLVASKVDPPVPGPDWKAALRDHAISHHAALAHHPWAASRWMAAGDPSPLRLRAADGVLRTLREAGFSKELTYHGYHSLVVHVLGFALQEQTVQYSKAELEQRAESFLRNFPADDYPDLAEHIAQHMEPTDDHRGAFEFGLDLILDGLERLRGDGWASRPGPEKSGITPPESTGGGPVS